MEEYTEETSGSKAAAELRQAANKMSIEERGECGALAHTIMNDSSPKRMLIIRPCGEIDPWEFSTHHWCGEAVNSIGISHKGWTSKGDYGWFGCALTREDAIRLRDFITEVERDWAKEQPPTPAEPKG